MNCSSPGSSVHGISQIRILEWVAISSSSAWKWKVKVKSLSRVRLFETPWTAAHQGPLSMGFSRQEYWSGVPFPSPGDLPDPGIKPGSPPLQADWLSYKGSPLYVKTNYRETDDMHWHFLMHVYYPAYATSLTLLDPIALEMPSVKARTLFCLLLCPQGLKHRWANSDFNNYLLSEWI